MKSSKLIELLGEKNLKCKFYVITVVFKDSLICVKMSFIGSSENERQRLDTDLYNSIRMGQEVL